MNEYIEQLVDGICLKGVKSGKLAEYKANVFDTLSSEIILRVEECINKDREKINEMTDEIAMVLIYGHTLSAFRQYEISIHNEIRDLLGI